MSAQKREKEIERERKREKERERDRKREKERERERKREKEKEGERISIPTDIKITECVEFEWAKKRV